MTAVRFAVPYAPVGVNATYRVSGRGGRGRMIKSPQALAYQGAVAAAARRAMRGRAILEGNLHVRLWFVFPSNRNDLDGPIKGTLDALQAGGLYLNDRQVVRLEVDKDRDPEAPRVEVEVVEVTP